MSIVEMISAAAEPLLDWGALMEAILAGHKLPRADIGDTFLYREPDTMLARAAWIDGMGMAVTTVSVFPENRADGFSMANGACNLYCDVHGTLEAIIDFQLLSKWKTAADSVLAARLLARPDAETILIVGAGAVAQGLREAYGAAYPKARFMVWNRGPAGAEAMASHYPDTVVATDLESAVMASDIISVATMARNPLIEGEWLSPGQHLDLVGAYRPDMREADDTALRRARVFVDSRETTRLIGEIAIPLERGVITEADILGDFYDIAGGAFAHEPDQISLFKSGGGAHLDLIAGRYILERWRAR